MKKELMKHRILRAKEQAIKMICSKKQMNMHKNGKSWQNDLYTYPSHDS